MMDKVPKNIVSASVMVCSLVFICWPLKMGLICCPKM